MIFNEYNTEWQTGKYSLFLGEQPALHDTINVTFPEIQKLALRQVSQRWVFDEFNHDQSRLDLLNCPPSVSQVMLMNLAYQWEADSVASRAIAPLLAPFVTNSELWEALMENTNMEITHAKTYSEIVRQCVRDPNDVFKMVMESKETQERASTVNFAFDNLARIGAMKSLPDFEGIVKEEHCYNAVMTAMWALYGLERIQFMTSFSATFANVEQGWFQSIGKAVQKIMLDELFCHAALDREVLKIEMATPRGAAWIKENRYKVQRMLDEICQRELQWAPHLLGEGRNVVGYTVPLASAWVAWNAKECYDLAGLSDSPMAVACPTKNPLPWMQNWIDIDKIQNAMQEADGNNYALNVISALPDDVELTF